MEKIRAKKVSNKSADRNGKVQQSTIKLPGSDITLYKPTEQSTLPEDTLIMKAQTIKTASGKEVPIVQMRPG